MTVTGASLRTAGSPVLHVDPATPEAVAIALEHLAAETGFAGFRLAARAVFSKAGRPPKPDDNAIAEARALLNSGQARSRRAALLEVARRYVPYARSPEAFIERCRRKMLRLEKSAEKSCLEIF